MRTRILPIAVFVVFALASVAPAGLAIAQEQQQEQAQAQSVEGTLRTVDLEDNTVVIAQTDESQITLVVNEETVVRNENGEATTLAALNGLEGQMLTASFVEMGDANVAISIQLVAE